MSATAARSRLNDWTWEPQRFEETFGERLPGRFHENWPQDKRVAVLLTFDTQGDVDATVRSMRAHYTKSAPDGRDRQFRIDLGMGVDAGLLRD